MATATDRPERAIRSFVRRTGRLTSAQQRALVELWPGFGVPYGTSPLDLARLFGRQAARTVEIGFGNGEHLLERACAEPGRDFLGIEVHQPGIGHLLLGAQRAGVRNLRVIAHDAVEVLRWQLPEASIDELVLLFPDPWPKKRHHKRRIVGPQFATLAASRLRSGGRWQLATDWPPYAEQMLEVLNGCGALRNCATRYADGLVERSATRFEQRGQRLGHAVHDLLFRRL